MTKIAHTLKNIIQSFCSEIGTKKRVIFFGILIIIVLILFNSPNSPGSLKSVTQNNPDQTIPDVMGTYTPEKVHHFLSSIGLEGRQAYQYLHLTTDLAFPIVYGLFLSGLISLLLNKLEKPCSVLPLFSVLAAVFDLVENFMFVYITNNYPDYPTSLVWVAQAFTILKFAMLGVSIFIVLFLLTRVLAEISRTGDETNSPTE